MRETTDAIGRVRKAEPAISADAQTVEKENTCGGWLEGFKFRLKADDRLKEKVVDKLRDQPDSLPVDVARRIPDAIRYTFCLEPIKYAAGYYDIKQRLEEHGYEMYYSRNWWTNSEYKGINTRWITAERVIGSRCSSILRRASTPSKSSAMRHTNGFATL